MKIDNLRIIEPVAIINKNKGKNKYSLYKQNFGSNKQEEEFKRILSTELERKKKSKKLQEFFKIIKGDILMELNKYIDSTLLKIDVKVEEIDKLCQDALKYHFETVCVSPYYVKYASELLKDSNVGVTTVIGFPNGYSTTSTKEFEAIEAINNGANEIDMVINVSALKNKDYDYVKQEIETIRDAIDGKVLKVIIETNLLTPKEIIKMTEICNETFVNFIKTCTGFNGPVKLSDIEIINENKNELLEIKVSGGIKTLEEAEKYINLGVTRIGTSNGKEIMNGYCGKSHEH